MPPPHIFRFVKLCAIRAYRRAVREFPAAEEDGEDGAADDHPVGAMAAALQAVNINAGGGNNGVYFALFFVGQKFFIKWK